MQLLVSNQVASGFLPSEAFLQEAHERGWGPTGSWQTAADEDSAEETWSPDLVAARSGLGEQEEEQQQPQTTKSKRIENSQDGGFD